MCDPTRFDAILFLTGHHPFLFPLSPCLASVVSPPVHRPAISELWCAARFPLVRRRPSLVCVAPLVLVLAEATSSWLGRVLSACPVFASAGAPPPSGSKSCAAFASSPPSPNHHLLVALCPACLVPTSSPPSSRTPPRFCVIWSNLVRRVS